MIVSLIVAASENNVIGVNNELPWRLPDDFRYFKRTTLHHHIIMGRKTFESFDRPLPERVNVVITRQQDYQPENAVVTHSLEEALKMVQGVDEDEIFIIGGGEIFRESMDVADKIYITRVHATLDGDTFFPEIDREIWEATWSEHHIADEKHEFPFTFMVYERKQQRQ